jgi:serine/threonine protein kinase
MAVPPGTRIGPYQILAPLGAGGMGEVYRARDTKLGRDVALKFLPVSSSSVDRVARFEREARLLASLNCPHIAAIYGFEESGNSSALVLELVDGETLADRLRRGRIPVSETLNITGQIADALEVAHRAGIVHRDLKPSNVMITSAGVVKVLDFGLAKALVSDEESRTDLSNSPTLTIGATRSGVVLGTAAYMSPEQARGQPVDQRTDIWAFGCVLFEMFAGRTAFGRETVTDTMAAVVGAEPDWKLLPPMTPANIRRLLVRCLQKDARHRIHAMADARIELEDTVAQPPETPLPRRRTWSPAVRASLAVCLAAALVVLWWAYKQFGRSSGAPPQSDVRITRLTDLPGLEESPAISPDGKSVAFTAGVGGKRQLFVQLIGSGAPLQITHDAADHECPRWSPDSSSILYFSSPVPGTVQGSIWQVPALGGMPRRVVNSIGCADVNQTDGRLVLFQLSKRGMQLVTAQSDGSRSGLVAEFTPTTYYLYPRWSPDGTWIAFQRGDSIRFDMFVVRAGGGQPQQLTHENNMMGGFAWLPDSSGIVYSSSRGGTMPYLPNLGLWLITLRDKKVRRVTSGEMSYLSPDIGKTGAIVVSRMKLQSDIWKFPVAGRPADNVHAAIRVTRQTGQVLTPTPSPDDRGVAFLSDSGGHANIWVVNVENGGLRQITYENDPKVAIGVPLWSPDGHTIAFVSSRGNQGLTFGVWLVDSDGSNLRKVANPGLGPAWSPDGR